MENGNCVLKTDIFLLLKLTTMGWQGLYFYRYFDLKIIFLLYLLIKWNYHFLITRATLQLFHCKFLYYITDEVDFFGKKSKT